MGLKENLVSYAKERLDLTEQVFVTVGVDRKRMRPAPGTILVEILGNSGETLAIDTIKADKPAPHGPWHVNALPTTYVNVGDTGHGQTILNKRPHSVHHASMCGGLARNKT